MAKFACLSLIHWPPSFHRLCTEKFLSGARCTVISNDAACQVIASPLGSMADKLRRQLGGVLGPARSLLRRFVAKDWQVLQTVGTL